MAVKITRGSGDVFVDLGMTAEEGREVVRRKMAERASLLVVLALDKVRQKKVAGGIDLIAQALAASHDEGHREGMMRAAEIAQRQARFHLEASAMSLPVEPSPIIAKDRARIANCIADAILSEANPEQGEGNGLALPVETATEKQAACLSRPDPSEKPGSSSGPVTAAPGANPSQALGAPVEPGAAGANATAASFSGRE